MRNTPLPAFVATFSMMSFAVAQNADEKFEAFFKVHLEETFRMRPLEATQLGDHRFDHLLDDISPKARAGWLARARERLAALPQAVSYPELSREGQIRASPARIVRRRAPALEPLLPNDVLPPANAPGRRDTIAKVTRAVSQEHQMTRLLRALDALGEPSAIAAIAGYLMDDDPTLPDTPESFNLRTGFPIDEA
jgi:hypothetical protein